MSPGSGQCIAGVTLPTAPRQSGSALQEFHCPLPQGSEAEHCRSCTAHWPQAVGSALQEVHCPLLPGSEAVHCRSCTAHCPRAVGQSIARVALSTAPRQ